MDIGVVAMRATLLCRAAGRTLGKARLNVVDNGPNNNKNDHPDKVALCFFIFIVPIVDIELDFVRQRNNKNGASSRI